jgi:hypothetical protein
MSTFPADRKSEVRPKLVGEYDALADLFLGDDQPSANTPAARPPLRLVETTEDIPPQSSPPAPLPVDAVLLGSLPVYASAWITQFVRAETTRIGHPIALVRTLAGEGSVDILGLDQSKTTPGREPTFDAAIEIASSLCARFILRTGETSEVDLATHEGVASVVVLTGIDEPALIAAYRTLKSLAPRWANRPSPPRVRIAAMGASAEQGRRAFEKIARAARVFLETPLEYAGHVERIEPAPSTCVFRGPTDADNDAVIRLVKRPRTPTQKTVPPVVDSGNSSEDEPQSDAQVECKPAAVIETGPDANTPAPVSPLARVDDRNDLVARVPGLATIPFAIPRCDGVELAADASGGLHLLALDKDDSNPTASLLAAQAWTRVNRQILAAACATALGSAIDPEQSATLHLFTDRPKRVRHLLDADIRVHFVGIVDIGGERGWCVAELN